MSNPDNKDKPRPKLVLPPSGLADEILAAVEEQRTNPVLEAATSEAAEEAEAWVSFTLGDESFALPASRLREVSRVEAITRLPRAVGVARGIATVRGQPLPVLSLRRVLGLGPGTLTPDSRLLVTMVEGRPVALLIDRLEQVIRLFASGIESSREQGEREQYLAGSYTLGDGVKTLLNIEHVLARQTEATAV